MTKPAFCYDYPKADNTVDIVVFGYDMEELKVLLIERGRENEPFYRSWALPGGFIELDQDLDLTDAARRELSEETGLAPSYLEQLYTFGRKGRDPRGRVISTAYLALVRPSAVTVIAGDDATRAKWFPLKELDQIALAFDHHTIIATAICRLRSKLRWQPVGIEMLPEEFTLSELQRLYEVILSKPLDKRNFRAKVMQFGVLQEVSGMRKGAHRPAQLYRFDNEKYDALLAQGIDFEV